MLLFWKMLQTLPRKTNLKLHFYCFISWEKAKQVKIIVFFMFSQNGPLFDTQLKEKWKQVKFEDKFSKLSLLGKNYKVKKNFLTSKLFFQNIFGISYSGDIQLYTTLTFCQHFCFRFFNLNACNSCAVSVI